MAQSHSSILVHLVFSTKERAPFLIPDIRTELFRYLSGILVGESATPHAIGGVADHVHLLLTLPRTKTIATLAEALKTSSSKWLKTKGNEFRPFSWQHGYGAFSVSHSQLSSVSNYIRSQERHHSQFDFKHEMRVLLSRHDIAFDEDYLWN